MHRECSNLLPSGRVCGRPVYVAHVGKDGGARAVKGADICDRCWRRQRDSDRALALRPRVDRFTLVREKEERIAYLQRRMSYEGG